MTSPDLIAFEPGRNCFDVARASRVALLQEGAAYFPVLAEAMERARSSILVVGWAVDGWVDLRKGTDRADPGRGFARFLEDLTVREPRLRVHVLCWDYPIFMADDKDLAPSLSFGLLTGDRVHLRMDAVHPPGASHHQKVVVIDDRIAFAGGLDVTRERWDTSEHRPDDERRVAPDGSLYGPFHDVQLAVSGEAAARLGDMVRERWRRATGEKLEKPGEDSAGEDPWPPSLEPDLREVDVAIARTEPAYDGRKEAREIEALYRDIIAGARRFLYLENQYFTSRSVGDALAERLREGEGSPEILLVQRSDCSGWLESTSMGVLRARLIGQLKELDRHGRFRLYHPATGRGDEGVEVHSKLIIADDTVFTVGSANLSNRSMGLDTECNLAFVAGGRRDVRETLRRYRHGLLADHLHVEPAEIARLEDETGSIAKAVDRLRHHGRSLRPLEWRISEWYDDVRHLADMLDPDRPFDFEALAPSLDDLTGNATEQEPRCGLRRIAALTALTAAALLLWSLWP